MHCVSVKVRAYPTAEQIPVLDLYFSHTRLIYNLAVEQQNCYNKYFATKTYNSSQRSKQLTELRKECDWLSNSPAVILQQALADFDKALSAFFEQENHGKPSFRSYSNNNNSFRVTGKDNMKIQKLTRTHYQVYIPKLGWLDTTCHKQPPHNFKSYTVKKEATGRYYVIFTSKPSAKKTKSKNTVQREYNQKNGQDIEVGLNELGIDLGIIHAIVTSDGTFYDFARPDLQEKITQAHKELSRKKKGSKNRAKARVKLARAYKKLANARKYFIDKATTQIARKCDIAVVEALQILSMVASAHGTVDEPGVNVAQKAGLNKAILDKAWGYVKHCLAYKMPGRVYSVPAVHTSQKCSMCGFIHADNRPTQEEFTCLQCGFTANADLNASVNVVQDENRTLISEIVVNKPYKRKKKKRAQKSQVGVKRSKTSQPQGSAKGKTTNQMQGKVVRTTGGESLPRLDESVERVTTMVCTKAPFTHETRDYINGSLGHKVIGEVTV